MFPLRSEPVIRESWIIWSDRFSSGAPESPSFTERSEIVVETSAIDAGVFPKTFFMLVSRALSCSPVAPVVTRMVL